MHYTNLKEVSAALREGRCHHTYSGVCGGCMRQMADLLDKAISLVQARRQLEFIQGVDQSLKIIDKELDNLG